MAAGTIAAYITLAAKYPVVWTLPVKGVGWAASSVWGFVVGPQGVPGWALIILLAFAAIGLGWAVTKLARPLSGLFGANQPSQPIRDPNNTRMFDVDLNWVFARNVVGRSIRHLQLLCPRCQRELHQDFDGYWACGECPRAYPNVPRDLGEIEESIYAWLRRRDRDLNRAVNQ